MIIIRKSPITGKINEMDIDVTEEEMDKWRSGVVIQRAMPNLTPDEREFILTGCTSEDWDNMFKGEE